MPMEFLTDAQVAGYGRFDGVPSRADLERLFVLDDADEPSVPRFLVAMAAARFDEPAR